MRSFILALAGVLGFFTGPMAWGQVTLSVPSTYSTIQAAIAAAVDGDTILVASGTYLENLDLMGKAVTLSGAGAYSTVVDGSGALGPVLYMGNDEGAGTVIEDIGFTGGTGYLPSSPPPGASRSGGGIYLYKYYQNGMIPPIGAVQMKRCRIYQNSAEGGGGVFSAGFADISFEECLIEQNTVGNSVFVGSGRGGGLYLAGRSSGLERCVVKENIAGVTAGLYVQSGVLELIDCQLIDNHVATSNPNGSEACIGGALSSGVFRRTLIAGNTCPGSKGAFNLQLPLNGPGALLMDSCMIVGNVAGRYSAGYVVGAVGIQNCTFSGNVDLAPVGSSQPLRLVQYSAPMSMRNSIVHGNVGGALSVSGFQPVLSITVETCDIEGGWPGLGNVDVVPGFVDPAVGDYRLAFGSPLVNAADPAAVTGTMDFEGEPRVLYGLPDIGADECDDIAYHASSSGTLFDPANPLVAAPALSVAGDDGGPDRRVTVPLHGAWSLSFDSPDWMASPPQFAIFGVLGEPALETVTTLPFGFGEMAFPPCPVLPAWDGLLFTLTSTVAGMPCVTVLPAMPGDLTIGPIPGCPIPLDVGFQAFLIDDQGQPQVSNLVIVNIR